LFGGHIWIGRELEGSGGAIGNQIIDYWAGIVGSAHGGRGKGGDSLCGFALIL
jgi:hypothetical protein